MHTREIIPRGAREARKGNEGRRETRFLKKKKKKKRDDGDENRWQGWIILSSCFFFYVLGEGVSGSRSWRGKKSCWGRVED